MSKAGKNRSHNGHRSNGGKTRTRGRIMGVGDELKREGRQTEPCGRPRDLTDPVKSFVLKHPEAAEGLLRFLARIRDELEHGEPGVARATKMLRWALEQAYMGTESYQAAFKLYTLWQLGHVGQPDEPLTLINQAIERSLANADRAGLGESARRMIQGDLS